MTEVQEKVCEVYALYRESKDYGFLSFEEWFNRELMEANK